MLNISWRFNYLINNINICLIIIIDNCIFGIVENDEINVLFITVYLPKWKNVWGNEIMIISSHRLYAGHKFIINKYWTNKYIHCFIQNL